MSPVQTRLDFPVRKLRSSSLKTTADSSFESPLKEESSTVKPRGRKPKKTPLGLQNPESPCTRLRSITISSSSSSSLSTSPRKSPKKDLSHRNVVPLHDENSIPRSHPTPTKSTDPPSIINDETLNPRISPRKLDIIKSRKKLLFKADVSRYQRARIALSTSIPNEFIGREQQLQSITRFLNESSFKSLYISGAPGTGKTASLLHLLERNEYKSRFQRIIFVNCMSFKSSTAVFNKVAEEFGNRIQLKTERDAKRFIENAIRETDSLLILDEIDQLDSRCHDVLYTIFEWPFLFESKLSLIGIANALDLTDRILPRLKINVAVCPKQLSFPAYTRTEINTIITERLKLVNDENNPIIKPAAIKFLAGKISALSGDIRKALDVCRRAIELAELEARKQTHLTSFNETTIKPIDLPQILKIVNEVYGSRVTSSFQDNNDANLPLVQKLLMASLLLMTKDKCKEVPLTKLYQTYVKVCKKRNMTPISESECVSMVSMLEVRGLMATRLPKGKNKEPRLALLTLRIDEKEVEAALQDKTLLSEILKDVSCIVK